MTINLFFHGGFWNLVFVEGRETDIYSARTFLEVWEMASSLMNAVIENHKFESARKESDYELYT